MGGRRSLTPGEASPAKSLYAPTSSSSSFIIIIIIISQDGTEILNEQPAGPQRQKPPLPPARCTCSIPDWRSQHCVRAVQTNGTQKRPAPLLKGQPPRTQPQPGGCLSCLLPKKEAASATAMYSGVCICLLLAVLSMSSSGQQTSESHNDNPVVTNFGQSLTDNHRNVRSPTSGRSIQRVDGNVDQKANLGALLAKYFQQARRGAPGKVSVVGLQNFDPTHRIKDRDYMGWMDFGRRSAEEYEYSS